LDAASLISARAADRARSASFLSMCVRPKGIKGCGNRRMVCECVHTALPRLFSAELDRALNFRPVGRERVDSRLKVAPSLSMHLSGRSGSISIATAALPGSCQGPHGLAAKPLVPRRELPAAPAGLPLKLCRTRATSSSAAGKATCRPSGVEERH
jgi:hypothetical protein